MVSIDYHLYQTFTNPIKETNKPSFAKPKSVNLTKEFSSFVANKIFSGFKSPK